MHVTRRITAQMAFAAGLILIILGIAFLMGSITGSSKLSILGSFFFVIIGGVFTVLAIKFTKRWIYFFFAAFFLLIGFFALFFALKLFPVTLAQAWPLLSVFAGLSLFTAGLQHFKALRYRFLIPSLAFIALGCVLLIFSFKVVSFSFKRFMANWWPLLILLAGLMLALLSLGSPKAKAEK
jgi:hypothetical protein